MNANVSVTEVDSGFERQPSPLHEIKSPLSAAHLGVRLLKDELTHGEIELNEAVNLLEKIEAKILEASSGLETYRDRLLKREV